jgi:hypothetical protein
VTTVATTEKRHRTGIAAAAAIRTGQDREARAARVRIAVVIGAFDDLKKGSLKPRILGRFGTVGPVMDLCRDAANTAVFVRSCGQRFTVVIYAPDIARARFAWR